MSNRTNSVSFNAGTMAPKKYDRYTVEYADIMDGGYTATYRYYAGASSKILATVTLTFDDQGRDFEGVLTT